MSQESSQEPDRPVVALAATFVKPRQCNIGPTDIFGGSYFSCEVEANQNGAPARRVVAVGFTDHQTQDDSYSSATQLIYDSGSLTFKSDSVMFRSPNSTGEPNCAPDPYAKLWVKVWAFYPNPANPMMVLYPPSASTSPFCGVCAQIVPVPGDRERTAPASVVPSKKTWLRYENVNVRNADDWSGTRLDLALNRPLRAKKILAYAPSVQWHYAAGPGHFVNSPLGTASGPAGMGYRFPALPPHCLVILQEGGSATVIEGQRRRKAIEIDTLPDRDISVHVNDLDFGTADNTGSFDLRVRILA